MGPDTVYAEGAGRITPYGGLQTDGTYTAKETGQKLGLPLSGGSNGVGEVRGGGDLCILPPEHCVAI